MRHSCEVAFESQVSTRAYTETIRNDKSAWTLAGPGPKSSWEQRSMSRRTGHPSLARFLLCGPPSGGGFLRVSDYIDPLRVGRGLCVVVVVPVPPLVWRGLGVTLRRVLPSLLTAERGDVEVAPCRPH